MPPARKPLRIELPGATKDEIEEIGRRTGRSVAFVIRRALGAAPAAPAVQSAGAHTTLAVTTGEDDPPDTMAKIRAAAGARPLEEAVAAAWAVTRQRFIAWAEREEQAEAATRADDLDAGLRDAAAPGTTPARLGELSKSAYPRVRALVAQHPSTPAELLSALAGDRERTVRAAVLENPHTPAAARDLAKQS